MRYTKVKKEIIDEQIHQIMRDNNIKEGNPFYFMRGKIRSIYEPEVSQ
jgi:hypothetical protein